METGEVWKCYLLVCVCSVIALFKAHDPVCICHCSWPSQLTTLYLAGYYSSNVSLQLCLGEVIVHWFY